MALPVDFSSEQSNLSSSRALHPSSSVPKLEVASWEAFICVVFQTFLMYLPWARFTVHHRIQLFSQCGGEQEGETEFTNRCDSDLFIKSLLSRLHSPRLKSKATGPLPPLPEFLWHLQRDKVTTKVLNKFYYRSLLT